MGRSPPGEMGRGGRRRRARLANAGIGALTRPADVGSSTPERTVCITARPDVVGIRTRLDGASPRGPNEGEALRPLGDARGPRPEHVDDPGCDGGLAEP